MKARGSSGSSKLELDAGRVRASLSSLPDIAAQETLVPPPLRQVYVPGSHHKALSLDSTLVIGMRGAGKSLWTSVLGVDEHRRFVARLAGNPALEKAEVRIGFGLDESNVEFPNSSTVVGLYQEHYPAVVWKTVVLRHALALTNRSGELPGTEWEERCAWVSKNQSKADALLTDCDDSLSSNGRVLLVLFDAMDRLATNWEDVRSLIMGALQFALSCRARKALRLKFFFRPDMEEDPEIWRFPDSSKLKHSRVELSWRPAELYGLILSHLANHEEHGASFRQELTTASGLPWTPRTEVFSVPDALVSNEGLLRQVVEAICGEWMGRHKKRGATYTWIPLHLADALGRISPRSFLLAFKHAAIASSKAPAEYKHALHWEGIQTGVAEASRIRIDEIKEDYPWVEPLLEAARDLFVPCDAGELHRRWGVERIRKQIVSGRKLPPRRFMTDPARRGSPEALIEDLIDLAVLYRAEDGRINMPDIFRVGFGIKRKGGVKPLRG